MAGSGRHLADEALAAHLAAGLSVPRAAAAVGLGERTVRRRLADREFRRLLDQRKSELVSEATALLGRSMSAAAAELVRLMIESSDAKVRLGAAREILAAGLKARQALDLERRLDDLEGQLGTGNVDVRGPAEPPGGPGPEMDDEAESDAGGDPGGPNEFVPAGRNDSGPVAGEATPLFGVSGPFVVQPTSWEIDDGGRTGFG
jgi:hypothetical protein